MAVPTEEITLSDGRKLAYCEFGDMRSTKPVIVYFHSIPSSRYEGSFFHATALQHGLRVISPDRPGMGMSTQDPKRTIFSYHADILQLLNLLEIKQFRVLSISGGGPYAYACLRGIPRTVCLGGQIISSVYPPSFGFHGMKLSHRAAMAVAFHAPSLIGTVFDWQVGKAARNPDPNVLKKKVLQRFKSFPAQDQKAFENEEFRTALIDGLREAFRYSGAGMAKEAGLTARDWGFELDNIDGEGLMIWHGQLDVNYPFHMAEKAATLIKGVETRFLADKAHHLAVTYRDEIMRSFVRP